MYASEDSRPDGKAGTVKRSGIASEFFLFISLCSFGFNKCINIISDRNKFVFIDYFISECEKAVSPVT